jgi:prevent-host-death family protein
MVHQISLEEASTRLPSLLHEVQAGNEVVITQGNLPVARLVAVPTVRPHRQFGSARHLITLTPDFDAPLADFAEYTQ